MDISVTDGGDVTTVGGEDTRVIRDSHCYPFQVFWSKDTCHFMLLVWS